MYVADSGNNTIRQITPAGVVTTLAGQAGVFGTSDGTGSAARFGGPQGIAVDDTGTLYVAEHQESHHPEGYGRRPGDDDRGLPRVCRGQNWNRFNTPQGIAVNAKGDLYVADTRNNTIRTTAPMRSSLVVDFGPSYGIGIRRGEAWSQLRSYTAEAILLIGDEDSDALIIDFGPGVGVWFWVTERDGDEFWFQIHPDSPTAMVGVDWDGDGEVESGVFDFPGKGLWWDDGDDDEWFPLHAALHPWPRSISTVTGGRT